MREKRLVGGPNDIYVYPPAQKIEYSSVYVYVYKQIEAKNS